MLGINRLTTHQDMGKVTLLSVVLIIPQGKACNCARLT